MEERDGLMLRGPDGGNPLGFLAALGALRVASLLWPDRRVRMGWRPQGTGWRPVLHAEPAIEAEELVDGLHRYCRYERVREGPGAGTNAAGRETGKTPVEEAFPHLAFAKDLHKMRPADFRALAQAVVDSAGPGAARVYVDFLAAFGCDACETDTGIQDTAFRTMSGAGHQHFLPTMLELARRVEPRHIREALLEPWRYEDPAAKLLLRWDPADDRRYALQWRDPSTDRERHTRGSVLGANRLAVEALPLFPCVPTLAAAGQPLLCTTGFDRQGRVWTWPIWEDPIGVDACASLLAHPTVQELGETDPENRGAIWPRLRLLGVVDVFQSERVSVGYYRNFTPARAL